MAKNLLKYVLKITALAATPAASTNFLRKICVVCSNASTAGYYTITSKASVATFCTSTEPGEIFDAGNSSVIAICVTSLNSVAEYCDAHLDEFYTLLISSDFSSGSAAACDVGDFDGVVGVCFAASDVSAASTFAASSNRCAFMMKDSATHKSKNMFYAFGKMVANTVRFANQQFIEMPYDDAIDIGDAEIFFEERVSFVMTDEDYGERLAFFSCGGDAIVAPYITREVEIDLQSDALAWITANEPDYNVKNAALLENELEKTFLPFIATKEITAGTVEIELLEDDFQATGYINIAKPRALWRVAAELSQTL